MTSANQAGPTVERATTPGWQTQRLPTGRPLPRNALVLYGSETGNAQDVAEEIGHLTERLRFDTTVLDLDSVQLQDLLKHTIVIIAISTTGQGEFPQNARSFWKILLSRALKPGVLRRVNFTTFGLGDSSYPRYNVAHRMLHGRMLQLGAQLFCQRGEGNEQHPEGHNGDFRHWIVDLKESLLEHFPIPNGQEAIANDVFLKPKWMLRIAEHSTNGVTSPPDINGEQQQPSHEDDSQEALTAQSPPGEDLLPIKGSITADLVANTRVTPEDHSQDVRLLDFKLHRDVPYGPGAVAVIYPKNFPQDVNQFIQTMGWQEMADVPLDVVPTRPITDTTHYPPSPLRNIDTTSCTLTLRSLLTNYLDILSIPRRSFFGQLAFFAKEGNEDEEYQKERILELANPELIDELWDYTTRPKRTILEIMPDFTSIKIPWQYVLSTIPMMRGRQFSIASGGELKLDSQLGASNTKVELLVAIANPPNPIIKYRKRYGVCTRYIASLKAGQQLNISIQQGYLNVRPEEAEQPVIMIGPGTGVAPMRAMIYERLTWAITNPQFLAGRKPLDGSILFFGCRNAKSDYYFHDEWERLEREGLKVFAAFSREKDTPRTYVQDLLIREGELVFDILDKQKGKLYVCGSSGNMPKGVRAALVDVLKEKLGVEEEEGEAYVNRLEKEGRYKQETW